VSINQVFASNICIAFVLDADIKCRILIHVRLLQIQLATCHLNNSIYFIYVAAIWLSIWPNLALPHFVAYSYL